MFIILLLLRESGKEEKKRGQKSPCCVWKEKEKRKQLLERERREGGRCRVAIGSFSSGCDPCRRLFLFLSDDFLWVYRWCSYNFHHTCRQSSPALPQQQQHKTSSEITKEREREADIAQGESLFHQSSFGKKSPGNYLPVMSQSSGLHCTTLSYSLYFCLLRPSSIRYRSNRDSLLIIQVYTRVNNDDGGHLG